MIQDTSSIIVDISTAPPSNVNLITAGKRERIFQRKIAIESRVIVVWSSDTGQFQCCSITRHDIIKIPAPPLKLIISNKRSNARETSAATRINVHTPLPVKL